MRIPSGAAFAIVLALAFPACSSSPDTDEKAGNGGDDAEAGAPLLAAQAEWENRIRETEVLARQRAELLPGLLERFGTPEPGAWKEADAALRLLESREKGFVYDRVLEILPAAMRQGGEGAAARGEMVRIAKVIRLSARLETASAAEWPLIRGELQALGSEGIDAAAVKLILKFRTQDPEAFLRAQEELLALGKGAVRHLVVAAVTPGVSAIIKDRCADTLARVGAPALPALLPLLGADAPGPSRFAAARALGRMAHPGALDALRKAEAAEEDPLIRCALLDALASIGGPSAVRAALLSLGHPDLSVMKFAARALGRMKAKEAAPDLVAALERAREAQAGDVRDEVVGALQAVTGLRAGADPEEWRRKLGIPKR
jgi:HEAT repeat protein